VGLTPLLNGSVPANGASNVTVGLSTVVLSFGFPMVAAATEAAVTVAPSIPWTPLWDASDRNLTLLLSAPVDPQTTYTVTVAPSAETQDGFVPSSPLTVTFSTGAVVRPIPAVVGTIPANGTTNVSLTAEVLVSFSVPMNATLLPTSFSIGPGEVPGRVSSPSGTVLAWSPSSPLAPNTTYTVQISTTAQSSEGVAIAHAYVFDFRTGAGNASTLPGAPSPRGGAGPSPSPAWATYGALAALGIVLGVVALFAWRRRSRPPPVPAPPGPAPIPAAARPPPWSEDISDPTGPRSR